jgi:hypothetical protein
VDRLPRETIVKCSFATSLAPSSVRPYRIHTVAAERVATGLAERPRRV